MTTVAKLIEEARVLLDLNPMGEACGGTLTVDRILLGRMPQAVREVLAEATLTELGPGKPLRGSIAWHALSRQGLGLSGRPHTKWYGSILLPDDFARMIVFEMSDWLRTADIITADDPRYARQRNPYRGVGGCPERPVAAIVPSAVGQQLEFYSCSCPCAKITQARYMPLPAALDNLSMDSSLPELSPVLADKVAGRMALLAEEVLNKGSDL